MAQAVALYEQLQSELDDEQQDFYTYEKKLDEIMTAFGHDLLEAGMGKLPADARKKND